ncbi:MAG: energy transducer TonB [Paludibacteraceae bacterium]|nr:energy transducer TonB [Paludibacteraceae bacterium]
MQAQWKQIEKDGYWMVGSSIEHIHCWDVMIAKEEEEIVELEENDIEIFEIAPVEVVEEVEEEELVFVIVETMPEFPGGQQAMMKFIAENVQYPANAMEKGIQGRVICQFVVEKDGKPSNIKVVRSSGDASLDEEAVRVIGTMPKWKPGIQRGKPVRVTFTLPLSFRLSDEPKESAKH